MFCPSVSHFRSPSFSPLAPVPLILRPFPRLTFFSKWLASLVTAPSKALYNHPSTTPSTTPSITPSITLSITLSINLSSLPSSLSPSISHHSLHHSFHLLTTNIDEIQLVCAS
ncbi:hypothetical protein K491DRAFT_118940 [Lophiostoma macrostomum CBS 122681]|uniref:Uncharacterized protein n=1 Tax=Lophiostoma macrostomum CBS 122681 TaxID=1314788 RepID=A0A6A6ST65_9PLEO|nr:hypothetical protein K491DRAFT_118940 [Lophiostoma macrostomum CBS 122681]